jgi:hypothetical protein
LVSTAQSTSAVTITQTTIDTINMNHMSGTTEAV